MKINAVRFGKLYRLNPTPNHKFIVHTKDPLILAETNVQNISSNASFASSVQELLQRHHKPAKLTTYNGDWYIATKDAPNDYAIEKAQAAEAKLSSRFYPSISNVFSHYRASCSKEIAEAYDYSSLPFDEAIEANIPVERNLSYAAHLAEDKIGITNKHSASVNAVMGEIININLNASQYRLAEGQAIC